MDDRWKRLALTLRDVLTGRGHEGDVAVRVTKALMLIEDCEVDEWEAAERGNAEATE